MSADAPKPDFELEGQRGQQFGLPHLKFHCPRCHMLYATSNAGRFICPPCGCLIQVDEPK